MRRELVRAAGLHHAARLEDHQLVAEGHRLDGVVRDHQAGAGEGGEVPREAATQLGAGAGVHGRERLVEQQQARVGRERARERDALRLAARERPGLGRGQVGQAHAVEHLEGARPGRAAALAARAQPEGHVLERRHVREQQVVLEDHSDGALLGRHAHAGRGVLEDDAVEHDPAALQRHETGQRAQQRGLAGGVGPQEHDDALALDRELDVELERALAQADGRLETHASPPSPVCGSRLIATGTSGCAGRRGRPARWPA